MRVAVTGASGFVGGAVVQALREHGHDVAPFGRREPSRLSRPIADYQQWDVASGARSLDVDALVHCAAQVGQWGRRSEFWRTNVHGTEQVMRSIPEQARLVYVSTASVYPRTRSKAAISESASDASRPFSTYGVSKLAGERVALERANTVVLRPHIVYGSGDSTLWPRFVAARRNGVITIPGDGSNRVSVTHIFNLVASVEASVCKRSPAGIYNIADSDAPTVDELLHTMFVRHSLPTTIRYLPRPVAWGAAAAIEAYWFTRSRPGEPPLTRYAVGSLADPSVLDISRACAHLGYVPRWTYRDGPL